MTGKPIRSECFHSVLDPYGGGASQFDRRGRDDRDKEQTSGVFEHDN
jgi:hypothetical protein